MHSPLQVSQISLSRSNSSGYLSQSQVSCNNDSRVFNGETISETSAAKDFLYQRQLAPNAVPLLVRIQRYRILWTAVLGVGAIVVVMFFLQQGIVLKSYVVMSNTSSSASGDVDTYNFFAGLVTSVVVKPLLGLVGAVVPAVLLCFFTQLTMQEKSSRWTRYSLALLGNFAFWLLINGFMAIYVREETVRVDFAIRESDLLYHESVLITNGSRASSAKTFLRGAMQMADIKTERAVGQCIMLSPRRLPAELTYGFPSRSWLRELLPLAPEATSTNTLSVSLDKGGDLTKEMLMPMNLTAARDLVNYAMRATDDYLREQDVPANATVYDLLDLPDEFDTAPAYDTNMTQELVKATRDAMNVAVRTRTHMKNFSIAESSMEFVQFPWITGSGNLVFEGVTLELPMGKDFLRRDVKFQNDTTLSVVYGSQVPNGLFEINAKEECGRFGCVVSPVGAALTTAPVDEGSQVRALPICLDENGNEDHQATMNVDGSMCERRSTTSVLVLSFAKRIVGDAIRSSLISDSASEAIVVELTNARKIYQVTAGRLSWDTVNLASRFGASCEANDCNGLAFPLSGDAQMVIVGSSHVPVDDLAAYTPSLLQWTPLVTSNVQEVDMSDILKSDFVFPRNFVDTSGWTPIDGSQCERERGVFLDHVESSHLYSEWSLQPAYQTALFWIFQNGVVKQKISQSSALAFDTNVKYVDVTLSVPHLSAILTFTGCAIMVLMGALVYFGGKRREADVERHFKPHHLARILLDNEAFSHKLLQCDLLNVGNKYLNSSELLDQFEITGLALRHRKRPSDVLIVPKAYQSLTASAASDQGAHIV